MCGKQLKAHCIKYHVLKHNTETPGIFRCLRRNCKKLFQNGEELRKHTKEVHEVDKPFQCDVCGKRFAAKKWIFEHVMVHTDQRLFKCDVKGCSYTQAKPKAICGTT
jgi:KRAB domain-containing zinc finger protein